MWGKPRERGVKVIGRKSAGRRVARLPMAHQRPLMVYLFIRRPDENAVEINRKLREVKKKKKVEDFFFLVKAKELKL